MLTAPPNALVTDEAVVLDGANGVTTAPRQGFRDSGLSVAVSLLAMMVLLSLRRRAGRGRAVIAAVVVAATVPGALHVVGWRADAPGHRSTLAAHIAKTVDAIASKTKWPQNTVHVAAENDDVLFPLGRYAVPTRSAAAGPGIVEIELHGSSLNAKCVEREARIVCGEVTR